MIATLVYTATPTKLGSLEIDCTVSERHQADVDVTEHPVEDSASISDHIRPRQEVVTINGKITATPNPTSQASRSVDYKTPTGETISLTTTVSEDEENKAATHIEECRDALYRIKNAGELVTIVTGIKTYENMAMKSLSFDRDGSTGAALPFSATFVQVRTVDLQTTEVRLSRVSDPKAKPHQKDGKKAAAEGPRPTALKRLGGFIGDRVGAAVFGGTP